MVTTGVTVRLRFSLVLSYHSHVQSVCLSHHVLQRMAVKCQYHHANFSVTENGIPE